MNAIDYRLYLVTDDPPRYAGNWLDQVMAAVDGGVTCVQYRDTVNPPSVQFTRLRALQDALRGRGVGLIVNNEVELAIAVRAEGVHVGQSDLAVPEVVARIERAGHRCEVGLSITALAQLAKVPRVTSALAPLTCLGVGPVFDATQTKADAAAAMGLDGLAQIARSRTADSPTLVAIGGITLENAPAVLAAGAEALAVVSAFSRARDPRAVAESFRRFF